MGEVEMQKSSNDVDGEVWTFVTRDVHFMLERPWFIKFVQWVPCLGYIVMLFWDGQPSGEGLRDVLNVMALITGLLLAGSATMPSWKSYDELQAIDARITDAGPWSCWPGSANHLSGTFQLSHYLAGTVFACNCFLLVGLLSAVFCLVTLSTLGTSKSPTSESEFGAWWRSTGAITAAFAFINMCLGAIYFFLAMSSFILLDWPDKAMEQLCQDKQGRLPDDYWSPIGGKTIPSMSGGWWFVYTIPVMIIAIWGQQYATMRADQASMAQERQKLSRVRALVNTIGGKLFSAKLSLGFLSNQDMLVVIQLLEKAGIETGEIPPTMEVLQSL